MLLELAQVGLPFLGGLFGQKKADKRFEAQSREARRQFDIQMNQSIQRRVADARAAGIHPLFALGGGVGASPTAHVGEGIGGDPMQRAVTEMAQALGVISQNKSQARLNEAEAAYLDAQTARLKGDAASTGRDVTTYPYGAKPGDSGIVLGDAEYVRPQVPVSKSAGVRAGREPGIVEIQMPDGQVIKGYRQELGLDEIGQVTFAGQRIPYVLAKTFGKMQIKALTGRWPTDEEWRKFRRRVKEMK